MHIDLDQNMQKAKNCCQRMFDKQNDTLEKKFKINWGSVCVENEKKKWIKWFYCKEEKLKGLYELYEIEIFSQPNDLGLIMVWMCMSISRISSTRFWFSLI